MDKTELRKEILQLIYDKGYRYIARNIDENGYIHIEKPEKGARYWLSNAKSIRLFFLDKLFEDVTFEDNKPLNIAEELGFIDWSTIPKDTKVLVSNDTKNWEKRHFKKYVWSSRTPFVVYAYGKTSYTANSDDYAGVYEYCKLAEEGNDVPTF